MKESSKTLTRKELYDLVWSSPLTKLAKEFSYSDSGLRKICKKHNIPLPKAGYWSKVKYNKKVIKIPLPISKKNQNDEIKIRIDKENNREKSHPNSIIAKLKKEIRNSKEISLNVPDRLSNPDPLIKKVKEDLKNKKVNKWGNTNGLVDSSNGVVNICVAKPNIPRALRFMDTFIKLIKKRGHHIEFNNGTCVVINDEYLKIRFREVSKRVIVNENNWERSELVPSGILSLRLDDGYPEKQWRDSEKKPIESKLLTIIASIETKAMLNKKRKLEWAKQKEEQEKQRKKEEELNKLKETELLNFRELFKTANRWYESQYLRNYIKEFRQFAEKTNTLTSEKKNWINWALEKVDWYDPFIEKELERLSDVDRNTLTTEHSNRNTLY